jgi:hypothetical protein
MLHPRWQCRNAVHLPSCVSIAYDFFFGKIMEDVIRARTAAASHLLVIVPCCFRSCGTLVFEIQEELISSSVVFVSTNVNNSQVLLLLLYWVTFAQSSKGKIVFRWLNEFFCLENFFEALSSSKKLVAFFTWRIHEGHGAWCVTSELRDSTLIKVTWRRLKVFQTRYSKFSASWRCSSVPWRRAVRGTKRLNIGFFGGISIVCIVF